MNTYKYNYNVNLINQYIVNMIKKHKLIIDNGLDYNYNIIYTVNNNEIRFGNDDNQIII